jgi:hypothetical protein
MRNYFLAVALFTQILLIAHPLPAQIVTEESLRKELSAHATPLRSSGHALLLREAQSHQYFLLGELHGEVEIPELLSELWPSLWKDGYRHVAAEVSPWAATHLQRNIKDDPTPVPGLWTRAQAAAIDQFAGPNESVLWGCDIEEEQPDALIRQIAQLNPEDANIRSMITLMSGGYKRSMAPRLLRIARTEQPIRDVDVNGQSLWANTLKTLQVESLRSDPHTRYEASEARELVMKQLFLRHSKQDSSGKVLLRFGRNHLHRGYDARGISTLGNFVAEWAPAQGESIVNVGVFAAGGKEHLAGETFDADERQDEPAFALLASLAGKEATIFDLRELRPALHSIPAEKRTALEVNLIYWADSYDYLLCYPSVSPLIDPAADPIR